VQPGAEKSVIVSTLLAHWYCCETMPTGVHEPISEPETEVGRPGQVLPLYAENPTMPGKDGTETEHDVVLQALAPQEQPEAVHDVAELAENHNGELQVVSLTAKTVKTL
jgi:hypothetical protein